MTMSAKRSYLCTIELAYDITTGKAGTPGTMFLTCHNDTFYIHWIPLDGTPTQQITTVFQAVPDLTKDEWLPSKQFLIQCRDIKYFAIKENPLSIIINREKDSRSFEIKDTEFVSLVHFIEQLFLNGIAVPGTIQEYCLEAFQKCRPGLFKYVPSHIQLREFTFKGMNDFWPKILDFYEKFLIYLDSNDIIPDDPNFPLATAARSSHARLVNKIQSSVSLNPKYEKITQAEYENLFDDDGKLKEPELFKLRLYHSGADQAVLKQILPFALGVYPLTSSASERKEIDEKLEKDFTSLYQQMENVQENQIKTSKRIFDTYRVIGNDVHRTDRGTNPFKNPKGTGSQILTEYLRMYSILNPPVGYLQGMNDLFVPIILAYIPNWTEDSSPIDENGEIIDPRPFSPSIFWCFESMLQNTNQFALLADVTEYCKGVAQLIHNILKDISPIAAIWMRRMGIKDLLWCYSDFVLMFKRTFNDVWPTWFQFNCSVNPTRWMAYFMCSIIITSFDQMSRLPDVKLTAMMDAFPKILKNLDLNMIGEIAEWIAIEKPIEPVKQQNIKDIRTEFKFFKSSWSTRIDA
ncbi:hypothetical protein TRFO_14174 [Tritrichomonas foetus]|uniref:Rab-GAP TBC domain-containing protein n=1 Tax=Tritrichomonas foetus TaxID=1144522 RepID=A0A1J4L0B5_9EUKA|nr:hypothetical protein TRFO_14174 [Tritrichomonas foetus]|eukprot:OHT15406.1 hypothetical protein TRFO_14174 [Tritrichomonas foetus]